VLQRIEDDAALGARYAVQLSLAYKGVWVRTARCIATGTAPASWPAAQRWLAEAAAQITAANMAKGLPGKPPGEVTAWTLESCLGNEPLIVVANGGRGLATAPRALPAGALCVLSVQLQSNDGAWHACVPLVLGADGASSRPLA
jgi:hypothetical protein